LRISTDDIPARGLPVRADLSAPWLVQASRSALGLVPETLSVSLTVNKQDAMVLVSGEAQLTLAADCDRCLSAVRLSLSGPVDLRYAPVDPHDDTDRDLNADDLEEGWFDGRLLDMTDVVSEQLTLWMPDRILCGSPGVQRLTDGTCSPIDYNSGPEVKRASPFAGLTLPKK
jgi:uncharacterized metal-binding protein YceD (DUF177 family)